MRVLFSPAWDRHRDKGLFILRLGLGIMFIFHGWPKISGGPHFWGMIGHAVGNFGIHFAPVFWGFMAACTEFFGGIFLILGLLTRGAALFLTIQMIVAVGFHHGKGDSLAVMSHAIEDGIVFLSLILIGPGRISLDNLLFRGSEKKSEE